MILPPQKEILIMLACRAVWRRLELGHFSGFAAPQCGESLSQQRSTRNFVAALPPSSRKSCEDKARYDSWQAPAGTVQGLRPGGTL
ncbi:MAG TPA: hypothetical protein VKJ45_02420 [Blastocatellia bacterium]|nr:hypothetical protein [Blastocatellia bacterium]